MGGREGDVVIEERELKDPGSRRGRIGGSGWMSVGSIRGEGREGSR